MLLSSDITGDKTPIHYLTTVGFLVRHTTVPSRHSAKEADRGSRSHCAVRVRSVPGTRFLESGGVVTKLSRGLWLQREDLWLAAA